MSSPKLQPGREHDALPDPRDLPGRLALGPRVVRAAPPAEAVSVLVAHGDAQVRASFAVMLKNQGYEVVIALNAAAAAGWLAQRPFDILLSDCAGAAIAAQGADGPQPYPDMAVILISGSDTASNLAELGANDRVTPHCNQGELALIVQRCLTRRILQRKHAQRFRAALETSNESMLDALLTALNTRDTETPGHAERVTAYSMELADCLCLPELTYHVERGALLHDIGKVGIPDRILHKPASLTADEWLEMKKHPVTGYQMCARIMLRQAAQIVLRHHERWDGSGYPDGLAGEAIPLGARIFAVADALDAMTSDRPHRRTLSFTAARQEIVRCAGRHFDPAIVRAFLSVPEARWGFIKANAAR